MHLADVHWLYCALVSGHSKFTVVQYHSLDRLDDIHIPFQQTPKAVFV